MSNFVILVTMLLPLKFRRLYVLTVLIVLMSPVAFLPSFSLLGLIRIVFMTVLTSLSPVMKPVTLRTCVSPPIRVLLPSLTLLLNLRTVWFILFIFLLSSLTMCVVITSFLTLVLSCCAVKLPLRLMTMKLSRNNPYAGCTVTLPEPWVAIRRPGVRLCLGDPVEVVTSFSRYCIPVYTLAVDAELTNNIKAYAHYSHTIKGRCAPDVSVAYLTLPRFLLALRVDAAFRALVLSSPLSVTEG